VPKAAVNKYRHMCACKDHVRTPSRTDDRPIDPEAKTAAVEEGPKRDLGSGVPLLLAPHPT